MWKEFAPFVVLLLVFALVLRRSGRTRVIRVQRMWIAPAIFVVLTGTTLVVSPLPGLIAIAAFIVVAIMGAGVGYLRARHQEITIDHETGVVSSKATQVGTILIAALFLVRYGIKLAFPQLGAQPGSHATADAIAWANGALIFSAAMLLTQAVWVWLRTQPLLAQHAARAVPPPAQP